MEIFGYTWEDIARAQQGGRLGRPIDLRRPARHEPTEEDREMLKRYGVEGLREMGYWGVLDRLGISV